MTTYYDIPKNEYPLTELYVVISRDQDGNEGIISAITPMMGATPMVFGKLKIMDKVRPLLEGVSKETGRKLYLMKYKVAEQLEIIDCTN